MTQRCFARAGILLSLLSLLSAAQAGEPPRPAASPALTNWLVATTSFQKAGASLGAAKYPQARSELDADRTSLPAPYAGMAEDFRERLDSALQISTNAVNARRDKALLDLCTDLRAFRAALDLQGSQTTNADELGEDPLYAWRLAESGDIKAALAEYRRRYASEVVEYFQTNWQDQIRLLEQHPANLTNLQFSVALVKGRYLKGLEASMDYFGALTELTRVAPLARSGAEATPVYQLILQCFEKLADDAGRDAWQQKFLDAFQSDPEVCALVYQDRGLKAYLRKDMNASEALFRKVCDNYTNSTVYGDSLYGLGHVLQDEQRYDEAMAVYKRMFTANLNEELRDPESSEDYPNYKFDAAMRMSEIYEAKKDLPTALEYALKARDRYPFLSYCKDCLGRTRKSVAERVARLEKAVQSPQ